MPSPQMQRIIDALKQRQIDRASQPPRTLEEIRAAFAPVGQLLPLPDSATVTAVDADGVSAHWLDVAGAEPDNILLFVHGGGYSLGSLRSHGPLAARIGTETKRRVLFIEYRLAPEHPFPAAVADVLSAWRWLTASGIDPASVVVAGDSAGGGLVLVLLHTLRDGRQPMPVGAVLISPWLDLTCSGSSMTDRADQDPIFSRQRMQAFASTYLNGADPRDLSASPLFDSHVGLPPLLVQVGGAEVLFSDSERFAQSAANDGVDVTLNVADQLPHVYHGALDTPEATAAVRQIADFTRIVGDPRGAARAPFSHRVPDSSQPARREADGQSQT
jgi:epsilon-lactone hydrolase